jgi:hypothetical protein
VKKFRLGYQSYLLVILTALTAIPVFMSHMIGVVAYVIYVPLMLFQCLNTIEMMFSYIGVDEKGITSKEFRKKKNVDWEKISGVYINNNNPLFKYSINVLFNSESISIDSWTKNSKELIKIIVDECKKRNIKVELMVEKIVED